MNEMFSEMMNMVKNQKKTFSAHFEASIQEVKEKDAEIEMVRKKNLESQKTRIWC